MDYSGAFLLARRAPQQHSPGGVGHDLVWLVSWLATVASLRVRSFGILSRMVTIVFGASGVGKTTKLTYSQSRARNHMEQIC